MNAVFSAAVVRTLLTPKIKGRAAPFIFGGELSPLYELRKSDIGAASLDCFSVSFTDSIELLCFLSGSEK